jgi:hypothetical protein
MNRVTTAADQQLLLGRFSLEVKLLLEKIRLGW